jgi:hypothetical protein
VNAAREALGSHRNHNPFHQLMQEAERGLKMSLRKDYYKVCDRASDCWWCKNTYTYTCM